MACAEYFIIFTFVIILALFLSGSFIFNGIKAFVDAQWLAEFDQRLAAYQSQLAQPGEKGDG